MIDLTGLLKDTSAYRTVKGDKESGRLSHAYLFISADGDNLTEYLKIFAQLLACTDGFPCGECRACKLIKQNGYVDAVFYPKGEAVNTDDINSLIEESYLKPVEADKKIFVISHAETMNLSAQNKLLKTLEEPPKNVYILMGATNEFSLLSTVKSRVKKLEIPSFSQEKLFDALKDEYSDHDKLYSAIACGDGTVGSAVALYGDQGLKNLTDLVLSVLIDMKTSSDVLKYSTLISQSKVDVLQFLSVLELLLRDMLVIEQGTDELVINKKLQSQLKNVEKFNTGSIIHALEKVVEANKRKKFNANATMLTEWLLFQILEGKHKWQKL